MSGKALGVSLGTSLGNKLGTDIAPRGAPNFSEVWGADGLHWYRLDLGVSVSAGKVTALADQIGSKDWSQGTAAQQPTYNATGSQNGQSSMTADGVNDNLKITGNFGDLNGDVYMLMVYKLGSGTTNIYSGAMGWTAAEYGPSPGSWAAGLKEWQLAWNEPTWKVIDSTTFPDTAFHVHEVYRSGGTAYLDMDGSNLVSVTRAAHSGPSNDIMLGRSYNAPGVTVEIFELGFATNYNDTNRDATRTYVNDRYGISI